MRTRGRAIRTDRWKYSVSWRTDEPGAGGKYPASPTGDYTEEFLYDLESDPHELNNLIRDPARAELRAELRETLKRNRLHCVARNLHRHGLVRTLMETDEPAAALWR